MLATVSAIVIAALCHTGGEVLQLPAFKGVSCFLEEPMLCAGGLVTKQSSTLLAVLACLVWSQQEGLLAKDTLLQDVRRVYWPKIHRCNMPGPSVQ